MARKRNADVSTAADKGEGYIPLSSEQQQPAEVVETQVLNRAKSAHKQSGSHAQGQGEGSAAGSKVVYVGNIPHGFYEKEMLGFFSQFGKLTRVRLSRNKKTGKAKHYAFLEFQHAEVAQIAADAMHGYFLFKQRLTVKSVPLERIHPQLFQGANQKFKNIPWRKVERQRHDRERTPAEHASRIARLLKKDAKRQQRIKAAGIDYEYDGVSHELPPTPKRIKLE